MATNRALRGRSYELRVLAELLDAVRASQSRALVVRGPPGIGKSTLVECAIESASDVQVARAVGAESEMELAFAALQQICAPMLYGGERLPRPQHDALSVAFGLSAGPAPDRFRIGLAAISLLTQAARDRPLLCVIDDAQWLDRSSAQALAFAARRLGTESVGLVFVTREPSDEFLAIPELIVRGLRDADARALLRSAIHGPLDERVRDRIVAEARGNPLALLELPRGLTPAELAGGFGLPDALSLSGRIEDSFRRRLDALPSTTRRLLLVAAADAVGEPTVMWHAADRLGVGAEAAIPAADSGLIRLGTRVEFRHPLVRSAVYRAASPAGRREAHRALAEATDGEIDPDRRAWHRAQAAVGPDEDVATELERSASRAQARGGLAAAAAFLERAAELTPDPTRRMARMLDAARTEHEAGYSARASGLLDVAEDGPLDELHRARLERLRGQIAFSMRRSDDVPALLLKAAHRLGPLDPALARETYLDALDAASYTGAHRLRAAAAQARAAPPADAAMRAPDFLLEGLTNLYTGRRAQGVATLKRAIHACGDESVSRRLGLAARVAAELFQDRAMHGLADRYVEATRDAGALAMLATALNARAGFHMLAGELVAAEKLIGELDEIMEVTGNARVVIHAEGVLAAWRGDESKTRRLVEASVADATARGDERVMALADYATVLVSNGMGDYAKGFTVAQRIAEGDEFIVGSHVLSELIEAAVRTGEQRAALSALERLTERAQLADTHWALGILAYSRALIGADEATDALYREAIDRLGRCRVDVYLGRVHLAYGEWLRRERRRLEAREQLRRAHKLLAGMGANAFAERAVREVCATGEHARKRTADMADDLTPQESRIVALARQGRTNPQIGERLFISPRTVEYHLRNVYAKLNISSRAQLDAALRIGRQSQT